MSPQRIQRQRTRGYRLAAGAVYVGRPTKFGNPYTVGRIGDASRWTGWCVGDTRDDWANHGEYPTKAEAAERAVALFREQAWLIAVDIRRELAGRYLACWCPLVDADGQPWPCHADVLLELANGPPP